METGSVMAGGWSRIAAEEPGAVLLERFARGTRRSLLFRHPREVIEAFEPAEVADALVAIDGKLAQGLHVAGYLAYEAGYALEPALADLACGLGEDGPLVWLGCYDAPEVHEDRIRPGFRGETSGQILLQKSLDFAEYARKVAAVREWIARGETYQANLTFDVEWECGEEPTALYERLVRAQPVAYAGLLHPVAGRHVMSLSPELFFARDGQRMVTRPMKGTAQPGMDAAETRAQRAWLQADEKNCAENVMIVDLLRSDLGRICELGSVQVTQLFEVERYPTVLQMTSTVEGRLRREVGYAEIFRALFPSGSIVGAPKIHTQRLLHRLEGRTRGVYTGAIGWISPEGTAEFNVAIRTVSLSAGWARLGVGSGITFDSDPAGEYAECEAKTQFLMREVEEEFELIETLKLEGGRYALLEEHLERMAQSAEYFGFVFEEARLRAALGEAASSCGESTARVRLLLSRDGAASWTASALGGSGEGNVEVVVRRERTSAGDRFLRHKTTRRELYDRAFVEAQAQGFADALFLNANGEVTEGAIHNVIACVGGDWVTPPLASGVLPGVYRRRLLEQGRVTERVVTLADLVRAEAVCLCNSVRGMRRVRRVVARAEDGEARETLWAEEAAGMWAEELQGFECGRVFDAKAAVALEQGAGAAGVEEDEVAFEALASDD